MNSFGEWCVWWENTTCMQRFRKQFGFYNLITLTLVSLFFLRCSFILMLFHPILWIWSLVFLRQWNRKNITKLHSLPTVANLLPNSNETCEISDLVVCPDFFEDNLFPLKFSGEDSVQWFLVFIHGSVTTTWQRCNWLRDVCIQEHLSNIPSKILLQTSNNSFQIQIIWPNYNFSPT